MKQISNSMLSVMGIVIGWLFGFYSISTFVGYLMANAVYIYIYIYIYSHLKVDFNNITDSDNPVARVCLRNMPFSHGDSLFPPRLFLYTWHSLICKGTPRVRITSCKIIKYKSDCVSPF